MMAEDENAIAKTTTETRSAWQQRKRYRLYLNRRLPLPVLKLLHSQKISDRVYL
jgi:hypothetical protein